MAISIASHYVLTMKMLWHFMFCFVLFVHWMIVNAFQLFYLHFCHIQFQFNSFAEWMKEREWETNGKKKMIKIDKPKCEINAHTIAISIQISCQIWHWHITLRTENRSMPLVLTTTIFFWFSCQHNHALAAWKKKKNKNARISNGIDQWLVWFVFF